MNTRHNWNAKNKTDLIIEVWEKLDCESVGASELEAIETVVRETYGDNAVDAPVVVARLLADEGAVLRHSEVLEMDVKRRLNSPYDAMFRNLVRTSGFDEAEASLKNLENLRKKLTTDGDREGLRLVRDAALSGKEEARQAAFDAGRGTAEAARYAEIAEWFAIWLQSPEVFEAWVKARRTSSAFAAEFLKDLEKEDGA